MDIFLAQTLCFPSFFIAGRDTENQMITDGNLYLSEDDARAFVTRKKENSQVKRSRVSKLSLNKITSVFLPGDRRELQITVELKGSLWTDFKPKSIRLSIRDADLTDEMLQWGENRARRQEFDRQAKWRREQNKRK